MRFRSATSDWASAEAASERETTTWASTRTTPIVVRYAQEVHLIAPETAWLSAVRAAQEKKGQDVVVLELREITSLTDYFIIVSGTNARQNQAISDEIYSQLKDRGELPVSLEGYDNGEWILQDYGDFIIHIFLPSTRSYYDLERLWRHAKRIELPPELAA